MVLAHYLTNEKMKNITAILIVNVKEKLGEVYLL